MIIEIINKMPTILKKICVRVDNFWEERINGIEIIPNITNKNINPVIKVNVIDVGFLWMNLKKSNPKEKKVNICKKNRRATKRIFINIPRKIIDLIWL